MRSLVLRLRQGCDIGVVISWLRLFTDKLKLKHETDFLLK